MKKDIIKRSLCSAAALLLSCSVCSVNADFSNEVNAADAVKYEFENGSTSGGKIFTKGWTGNTATDGTGEDYDLTNASGGFSYLDQKGTTVCVDVTVEEAGLYELSICYCEPSDPNKKVQYLNVNGVNQGEVSFPHYLYYITVLVICHAVLKIFALRQISSMAFVHFLQLNKNADDIESAAFNIEYWFILSQNNSDLVYIGKLIGRNVAAVEFFAVESKLLNA